mmetsp:Transcript_58380/g.92789  ORF Transcript_58380/g.92789 Transcript_58380/m.92789 type:complete len:100 (+) Transcript_58380:78-377(+)
MTNNNNSTKHRKSEQNWEIGKKMRQPDKGKRKSSKIKDLFYILNIIGAQWTFLSIVWWTKVFFSTLWTQTDVVAGHNHMVFWRLVANHTFIFVGGHIFV